MKMFAKLCSTFALAAATLALPAVGEAAVIYQLVTRGSSFGAAPGGTATVDIYLRETVTPDSTSLLTSEDGLFSVGAQINRAAFAGTGVAPTAGAADAIFDDNAPQSRRSGPVAPAGYFFAGARVATSGGPQGEVVGTDVREVKVGTFSFAVAANAVGSSTYSLADVVGSDDTMTNAGTQLDLQIGTTAGFPNGSFTVLAPEPASLAALAGVGIVALRRRRQG